MADESPTVFLGARRDPARRSSGRLREPAAYPGGLVRLLGRNEDAVEVLKTAEFADSQLYLAIAYIRLGREADVRAAVEQMLKSNPTLTVESWREATHFRDPTVLDQLCADLARAGLPGSATQ